VTLHIMFMCSVPKLSAGPLSFSSPCLTGGGQVVAAEHDIGAQLRRRQVSEA
jgi:hypothetical protein